MLLISNIQSLFQIKELLFKQGCSIDESPAAAAAWKADRVPVLCWWEYNLKVFALCVHFFFAASKLGADTLTFPGMFLDRSASWNKESQMNTKKGGEKWRHMGLEPLECIRPGNTGQMRPVTSFYLDKDNNIIGTFLGNFQCNWPLLTSKSVITEL